MRIYIPDCKETQKILHAYLKWYDVSKQFVYELIDYGYTDLKDYLNNNIHYVSKDMFIKSYKMEYLTKAIRICDDWGFRDVASYVESYTPKDKYNTVYARYFDYFSNYVDNTYVILSSLLYQYYRVKGYLKMCLHNLPEVLIDEILKYKLGHYTDVLDVMKKKNEKYKILKFPVERIEKFLKEREYNNYIQSHVVSVN